MTYKSKFGFGCMRLPLTDEKDPTSIDQELFNQMVDIYMEKGFNYFDTSYAYHNGTSEIAIRKAVVDRYPRSTCFSYTTSILHGSNWPKHTMHLIISKR